MHLLQPVGDQLERFAQALFQRGMQLLVDGAPHLVELGRVVGLDVLELLLQRGAHFGQPPLVALGQLCQLLLHGLAEAAQRARLLLAALLGLHLQALTHRLELLRVRLGQLGQLLGEGVDLVVLHRGDAGQLSSQHLLELPKLLRDIAAADARGLGDLATQLALDALVAARQFIAQRRQHRRHIAVGRARYAAPDQHTQHGHHGHAQQRQ